MQNIPNNFTSLISTARLVPIQKPYGLNSSALVEDQNGIQVLGLGSLVLEEIDYIVAAYMISLD